MAVCEAINKHPKLELQLIVTGGALNLDIPYEVDYRLNCLVDGDNGSSMILTSNLLSMQLVPIFEKLKPDIVYIHGDRFEMLGVAMTSNYMGIDIAHAEGGEDTGCIDDNIRRCITELASVHLPVTRIAYWSIRNIDNKESVYLVGSPALDLLNDLPPRKIEEEYIVVLVHPNTTVNEDIGELIKALDHVKETIIWVNPNFDAGAKKMLKEIHKTDYEFVKDLSPQDFYSLIKHCKCLIGNTSSGIKEGAYLGVPYICIGDRQGGREIGTNTVMVDYDSNDIVSVYNNRFGDGNSAVRIASILAGDVDG
jgi:UDP-hydrolysing UDP-N-acetyl-D-glucosamine 2-epimerase